MDRFFDVPASRHERLSNGLRVNMFRGGLMEVLLEVPQYQTFSASGSGVISHKTALDIGFQGINF